MQVNIKSLNGQEMILEVHHVIENCEGIYVAKDANGTVFTYKSGEPIKFNTASRTGMGYLGEVEYIYQSVGYTHD